MSSSSDARVPNARFTGRGSRDPTDESLGQDRDDAADEGEVAGLAAVAVHRERLVRSAAATKAGTTAA